MDQSQVIKNYICSLCGPFSVIHAKPESINRKCLWCQRYVKCLGVDEDIMERARAYHEKKVNLPRL